ncbi:MAG: glycoside hydrolase domain-containing protein, partial [Filifactoraceae bacterium]
MLSKKDGDVMVSKTQEYLNTTYSSNPNWVRIDPDGKTGWATIRGLIRALQIEVGISTPNGTFGPATEAACPTLKKELNPTDKTKRLVYILQGAMWCKGFSPGGFTGTFADGTESGVKKFQASAGLEGTKVNGIADPMIFKALLNMDAYVLVSSGDPKIREIQMCLNRDYHRWIGLKPTDGRYGRDTNKALIYAIQVEEGIAEPNGTFGPQTQSLLPTLAPGSKNAPFVKIMQYALYCNRFDPTGFTGVFGNGTLAALKKFQSFCMLTADGYCGKSTWSSLLVSCGDKDRKGTACDCSQEVTPARAKTLKDNGYKIVGRYIAGGEWKKLKVDEAKVIFDNGLRIFPIFQKSGNSVDSFNPFQGKLDGDEAIKSSLNYGFPDGTTIYFAVDFDAVDDQVTSNIIPYFRMIKQSFFRYNPRKYKIGIYGARNICSRVSKEGISVNSFVSDMSTGFSGNLGYPLPEDWAFDQIKEYTIGSGNGAIAIDNDICSNRDMGVDRFEHGPVIPDIPSIPDGVNERELLDYAGNEGGLLGANVHFETFNKRVMVAMPSIYPKVTVEAEVALQETFTGPYQNINLITNGESFTTSFFDTLTKHGIEHDITELNKKALMDSISKLRISKNINPNVKYYIEFTKEGTFTVTFEVALAYQTNHTTSDITTIYQKIIITIHPTYGGFGKIQIPIASEEKTNDINYKFISVTALLTLGLAAFAKDFISGVLSTGSIHVGAITGLASFFLIVAANPG